MTSPARPPSPGGCDVLVIEDDEDCRDLLLCLLSAEGYRVHTAASGAEALQALARLGELPRLILLDLVMPGMSGFECLRVMRQNPVFSEIPVVVHSGLGETDELCAPPRVECWLQKPVKVDVLLAITRQFVG